MSDQNPKHTVFVGNLDEKITEQDLSQIFHECNIELIKIIYDWFDDKKSRGFGYVSFKDSGSVNIALSYNYTLVGQRPIRIMKFERNEFMRKLGKANLYLRNLPENIDELKLYNFYKSFGTILSIKVEKDSYLKNSSYAYIQFENLIEAEKAISITNKADIFENGQPVEIFRFVPSNLRYMLEYNNTLKEIKILKDQEKDIRNCFHQSSYLENNQQIFHHEYNNLASHLLFQTQYGIHVMNHQHLPFTYQLSADQNLIQHKKAYYFMPVYNNTHFM